MKKQIVGWLLVAAFAIAVSPFVVKADTVSDLQAQVAQLIQMVAKLQAQLSAQGGGQSNTTTSAAAWCYTFNKSLRIDDQNSDVTNLARALIKEGLLSSDQVFQDGRTVLNFDEITAAAVTGFQEKYKSEILTPNGLSNGTGFVGASTRAKLNKLYGCNNGNNNQSTGNTTTGNGSATIPAGKYICGYTNSIPGNPIYCDLTSSTQSITPSVSSVTPQPVQVGSPLTVYFSNGGSTGSVILKTVDGTKSWHIPYTTGKVYNGFTYYDGSKITFTVPSMIGRGQLPENTGYETPVPITSGIYNLFVYQTGMSTTGNAFQITINVPSTISGPTISSIDGPSSIIAGQQGTWSIAAKDGSIFAVIWADGTPVSTASGSGIPNDFVTNPSFTHTFTAAGTYYVQFFAKNSSGQVTIKGFNVTVQTSTTQPASSNAQVSASLVSANFDYAGTWGVFSYDGSPDWTWKMSLSVNAQKTIKSISIISNADNEGWSTSANTDLLGKQLYPLVVGNHDSGQINKAYSDNLSISQTAGNTTEYSLYGQIVSKQWSGGKIIVIFTDGSQTTAAIPASSIVPASSTSTAQPSITVLSPNGGENIVRGSTQTIKWNSSGISSVYIKLRKGTDTYYGSEGAVTSNVTASQGYFNWYVPTTLPEGNDYSIRVIDSNVQILDDSNSPFTISAPVSTTQPSIPPVCAQVMKQCSDGSLVGYISGTCTYKDCPTTGTGSTVPAGKYICGQTNSVPANPIYCDSTTTTTATQTATSVVILVPALKVSDSFSPATVQSGTSNVNFANIQLDATTSGEDVRIDTIYPTYRVVTGNYSDVTNCRIVDSNNTSLSSPITPSMYGIVNFTFNPSFTVTKGTVKTVTLRCDVSANAASGSSYKWAIGSGSTVVGYGATSGTKATITSVSSGDSVSIGNTTSSPTVSSGSVQFSLASQTEDRAGMWNTFVSNSSSDWGILASITLNSAKTVSSIDFYSGSNEQWSTSMSSMYPLVVFNKSGTQLNSAYGQTIPLVTGTTQLMLYAQIETSALNSPRLVVTFTDGTTLTSSNMLSQASSISNMASVLESYRLILEKMKSSL